MRRLSLLFLLTGCMSNDTLGTMSMSQDNIWNLTRLCIGMEESQVLQIMHHPYKKTTINHEGEVYNIWFYVTKPSALDQSRLLRPNLTPLTFQNGVLQGWGFDYYHFVLRNIDESPRKEEKRDDHKSLQKVIEGIEEQKVPVSGSNTTQNQEVSSNEEEASSEDVKEPSSDDAQKKKDPLTPKDKKMLEEERDQNFDFW